MSRELDYLEDRLVKDGFVDLPFWTFVCIIPEFVKDDEFCMLKMIDWVKGKGYYSQALPELGGVRSNEGVVIGARDSGTIRFSLEYKGDCTLCAKDTVMFRNYRKQCNICPVNFLDSSPEIPYIRVSSAPTKGSVRFFNEYNTIAIPLSKIKALRIYNSSKIIMDDYSSLNTETQSIIDYDLSIPVSSYWLRKDHTVNGIKLEDLMLGCGSLEDFKMLFIDGFEELPEIEIPKKPTPIKGITRPW